MCNGVGCEIEMSWSSGIGEYAAWAARCLLTLPGTVSILGNVARTFSYAPATFCEMTLLVVVFCFLAAHFKYEKPMTKLMIISLVL